MRGVRGGELHPGLEPFTPNTPIQGIPPAPLYGSSVLLVHASAGKTDPGTGTRRQPRKTCTHIRVCPEQVRGAAGAHLVTLQPNDPFTDVHARVERALRNDDITPGDGRFQKTF